MRTESTDVEMNEVNLQSSDDSENDSDEDPFERKAFKQRMTRHFANVKRFFTRKTYRSHVLNSLLPRMMNYYVEPESTERRIVDLLMVITIMWNVISVPYRTCFETHTHVSFFVVDVVTDVIAWINLVFQLLQAVEEHGELIKSRRASWRACFNVCDCIACETELRLSSYITISLHWLFTNLQHHNS